MAHRVLLATDSSRKETRLHDHLVARFPCKLGPLGLYVAIFHESEVGEPAGDQAALVSSSLSARLTTLCNEDLGTDATWLLGFSQTLFSVGAIYLLRQRATEPRLVCFLGIELPRLLARQAPSDAGINKPRSHGR
jgi:hypothetical protein